VALVITGLLAVVVMRAVTDETSNTLASVPSVNQPTTTASGGVALPGPGGPLVTDTVATPGGPVIAGIDAAVRVACGTDKTNLQTVIEAYEQLEEEKPANEQVMIDAGLLRHASDYWDVANGVIVPQDPRCT